MMRLLRLSAAFIVMASCAGSVEVRDAVSDIPPIPADEWERLVAAEDARAAAPELAALRAALRSDNHHVRAMAVRGLGRTERGDLLNDIAPLLRDTADSVRIAAAHAIGDVARDTLTAATARSLLLEALPPAGTRDPAAAAIAETLGRLPSNMMTGAHVVVRLMPYLAHANDARIGAVRGLYYLARRREMHPAVAAAAEGLSAVARRSRSAHERTVAIAALAAAQVVEEPTIAEALRDSDAQVRRAAAAAASTLADTAQVRRMLVIALDDSHPAVRYDALAGWARRLASTHGCAPVVTAIGDDGVHVSLLAVELLGLVCARQADVALLDSIAAAMQPGLHGWHHAARAVASLAVIDRAAAQPHLRALARHQVEFARAHAARAARTAADTVLLYQLARDSQPNVRTAAVSGLSALVGHAADSVYIAQLTSNESELLMTAAAALEGARVAGVAGRLLDALDRVTAQRRETSRDARVALLERVRELGTPGHATRVQPYLRDFDPRVAQLAAGILEVWTGTRPTPAPQPLPLQPLPTFDDAVGLSRTLFVLVMDDGAEVEIRLLPFDAPTNAWRFARLARGGYYTGLTVHRIAPNFVVQGGSPGANEYNGDSPFTRDELAVPNMRGTMGLSTRGRDTGDAQFFINLIDNVRLDHDYTVFGIVTRGMNVVDRMLEGVVIAEVREETR